MQVQNFELTAGTLRDFQDFCERLESALDKPVTDNKSNKMSWQEKDNKKRRWNNNNDKVKKQFCMLHGHNPTHSTKQCHTLKKEAEKHKKSCKNDHRKIPSVSITPEKRRFACLQHSPRSKRQTNTNNVNKELRNFENMSVSGEEQDKWKEGPGLAKKCKYFMTNHHVNLATKSNEFKFKSLDECLNNLHSMRTYLKGQYNKKKRQRTKPTKLVPISFVELTYNEKQRIRISQSALWLRCQGNASQPSIH